jgi:hypothetical protein
MRQSKRQNVSIETKWNHNSTAQTRDERPVKDHITIILPDTPDPLQFAYCPNRSTYNATAIALHNALTHLDKRNTM